MQPFRIHQGKVVAIDRANIDTDQIIPKQFLKRIERTGFGEFLFYDWRRMADGKPDLSFALNRERNKGASLLVTGKNFGCGSSREHAVWALQDFGFRAVIASSFADIFANNCVQNGVLTVVVTPEEAEEIIRRAEQRLDYQLTVDLEKQQVRDGYGLVASFPIEATTRHRLLNGLDDIALTLADEPAIAAFEARHPLPRSLSQTP